jgi:hypothetical protein
MQQLQVDELRQAVADNGGDRLERLAQDIRQREQERSRRQDKAPGSRRARLVDQLGLARANDEAVFSASSKPWRAGAKASRQHDADLQNALTEHSVVICSGQKDARHPERGNHQPAGPAQQYSRRTDRAAHQPCAPR